MKKPVTLLLLCILTFFWSGVNLFYNGSVVANAAIIPNAIADTSDDILDIYEQNGIKEEELKKVEVLFEQIKTTPIENFRNTALISLVSCLLIIAGAAMMWDLKKRGYQIYLGGIALGILAPIPYFGTGMLGWTILTGVIGAGLYRLHLKYLA